MEEPAYKRHEHLRRYAHCLPDPFVVSSQVGALPPQEERSIGEAIFPGDELCHIVPALSAAEDASSAPKGLESVLVRELRDGCEGSGGRIVDQVAPA
jgi:hypothetical protein